MVSNPPRSRIFSLSRWTFGRWASSCMAWSAVSWKRRFDTETNQRRSDVEGKPVKTVKAIYIYIYPLKMEGRFFFKGKERCMYIDIDIFLQVVFNF